MTSTLQRTAVPVIGTDRRPAGCGVPTAGPVRPRRSASVRCVRAAALDVAAAPDYVARRLTAVALVVLAVVSTAAVVGGLRGSFGGDPAAAAEATSAVHDPAPAYHVARRGDTLWSIAADHRGTVDHARYVDALVRLNGGATIAAGQRVLLP